MLEAILLLLLLGMIMPGGLNLIMTAIGSVINTWGALLVGICLVGGALLLQALQH